MAKLVEQFVQAVSQVVDNRAVNQDTTISATVVSVVDVDTGEYKVQYQSNIFSAFSQNPETTYKVKDQVYVLVPQSDFSSKKIIVMLVSNNKTYAENLDSVNYYTEAGPNLIKCYIPNDTARAKECNICACPEDQVLTLLDPANYTDSYYDRDDSAICKNADSQLQYYSDKYEYLKFSAKFKTNFNKTHSQGQYALRLCVDVKNPNYKASTEPDYDPTISEYEEVYFDLGFATFSGAPYQFESYIPQVAYFSVPKGMIKHLKYIHLIQDGQFLFDVTQKITESGGTISIQEDPVNNDNNIHCKDIELYFAEKVNLDDGLYHCWIATPMGDRLSGSLVSTSLIPHFYYKNTDYIDDCEVRWFRRRSDIVAQTPTEDTKDQYNRVWTDYTGPGWEPIENIMDDAYGTTWHKIDGKELIVYQAAVKWKWDYKCVCIYNDGKIWQTAEHAVLNTESEYDLVIEDVGGSIRQLYINNLNKSVKIMDIPEDASADAQLGAFNRHWFGKWYVYLPDGSYTPLKYNNQYMIEGPIDITNLLKNAVVTFRVQCYDPYIYDPSGKGQYKDCRPIGELEYIIVNNEENAVGYWTGDTSFNYDANGKAKNSLNFQDNHVTLELYFPSIDGVSGGGYYGIDFYAPDGQRLYTKDSYDTFENDGNGYDPQDSMITDMYIDDAQTVHFKVKAEYDGSCQNNTISAMVRYYTTDKVYEVTCPILFTKDGEQGTQGSDWVAPIYPCNVQPYLSNNQTEGKTKLTAIYEEFKRVTGGETQYQKFLNATYNTSFRGDNGVRVPQWEGNNTCYKEIINIATGLNLDTLPTLYALCKDYWEYRTDQWINADPNDIVPSYLKQEELPNPIILKRNGASGWKQDVNNKVCFRPFVSKNGVPIEQMNPYDGYFYKIWWDVRFSNAHEKLPYGSMLRLHHVGDGSMFKWRIDDANPDNHSYYNWGDAAQGIAQEYDAAGDYIEEADGLMGFNAYPSRNMIGTNNTLYEENHGAIEVRYADNQDSHVALSDIQYVFFVKARIEIYKNGYDYSVGGINPGKSDAELVATITSWHPVDVFLNPGNVVFDRTMLHMNWPSFVIYNSYGKNPVLNICNSGRAEVCAYYNNQTFSTDDFFLYQKKLIIPAVNNTIKLGNIVDRTKWISDTNLGIETETKLEAKYQTYEPTESLTWQDGLVGSLMTEAGKAYNADGIDQWRGGQYIRCQIFTMNTYGNSQINGWDGESISTEDGAIFAPTVGAGYKDKYTNAFSGVIMGVDSQWKKDDLTEYQKNIHGYDRADINAHPYLAGVYGYQRGNATFGLMENGTAFFGRADRGGRIIIDGYHATMYGGANGWTDKPKYNDPMWNTMRLNFVDLYHPTDNEKTGGNVLGFDGEFFTDADFPDWLKKSWRQAYVTRKGYLPYWQIKNPQGEFYTYDDLVKEDIWYGGNEYLDTEQGWKPDRLQGIYTKEGSYVPVAVPHNLPINYWDNDVSGSVAGQDVHKWSILNLQEWLTQAKGNPASTKAEERKQRERYLTQVELDQELKNISVLTKSKDTTRYAEDISYKQDYDYQMQSLEIKRDYAEDAIKARVAACAPQTMADVKHISADTIWNYINQYLLKALEVSESYSSTIYPDLKKRKRIIAKEVFGCRNWDELLRNVMGDDDQYLIKADYQWLTDNCRITHQHSVFGPSRAATTPAIEIGQHIPGLRPGRIGLEDYNTVMQNLDIPGDRNFMVTYDGTMWAMNGVFMGNVIGSNIVGGTIVGGEILIGDLPEGATYWEVDTQCDWTQLLAPTQIKKSISAGATMSGDHAAVELLNSGVINASKLNVYGGNINIGGFHVLGADNKNGGVLVDDSVGEGRLVQFGESDFIGPTHIYGNIGIGPNRRPLRTDDARWHASSCGNLFQTYGEVALGVVLTQKTNLTFHKLVAGPRGAMWTENEANPLFQYKSTVTAQTDPLILDDGQACIEAYAMFGIHTADASSKQDSFYRGHFWPLSFSIKGQEFAAVQTMDVFLHKGPDRLVDGQGKNIWLNYFRVGHWGCEANELFFLDGKRTQNEIDVPPDPDDGTEPTAGYCGIRSMQRWIDTDWGHKGSHDQAIALTSWKGYHVVIKSDMDIYSNCRGSNRMYGDAYDGASGGDADTDETWYDDINDYGAFFCVGCYDEFGPGATAHARTLGGGVTYGRIAFTVRTDRQSAAGWVGGHTTGVSTVGIELNPENLMTSNEAAFPDPGGMKGTFVYSKAVGGNQCDVHIVRYAGANGSCSSAENDAEMWIGETRLCSFHPTEVRIQADGGSAHAEGAHYISAKPGEIRFQGWSAEQQIGIYARFA